MNELQLFKNSEFGELGVLEIDGKMYFPATACAKILGHENPARAIRKFCKGVTELVTPTKGGTQTMRFILEGDLYRLIVSSKLPSAEKFERWVFDEVLPTIRKTGGYGNQLDMNMIQELITRTATAVVTAVIKELIPVIHTVVKEAAREAVCERSIPALNPAETSNTYFDGYNKCKLEMFPSPIRTQVDLMIEDMMTQQALNFSMIARFCTMQGYQITSPSVKKYFDRQFRD